MFNYKRFNLQSALIVAGLTTHWALHMLRARGYSKYDVDTIIMFCEQGRHMTGNVLKINAMINHLTNMEG